MNYIERVFQEILATDKEINIVQNILLVELFFSRSLYAFDFFLILHSRIQSLKESRVVAIVSFSIELKETIVHKCSKKGAFEILEELMLYFISIRAWVENLRIKNCIILKTLWLQCRAIFTRPLRTRLENLRGRGPF